MVFLLADGAAFSFPWVGMRDMPVVFAVVFVMVLGWFGYLLARQLRKGR